MGRDGEERGEVGKKDEAGERKCKEGKVK